MGGCFLFFLVSLSAAFLGWGMVFIASRIERERQERYAERCGKKGPAVPPPKPFDVKAPSPWPRRNSRRSARRDRHQGCSPTAQTGASPRVCPSSQCGRSLGRYGSNILPL
jgi:hypothetical protein